MANNFRWFNQQGYTDNSNADSPSYVPSREGGLSILGKTLQGIAAPFAGDYQFNQRQAETEIRQQQADQEFQALLMKNAMEKQKTSDALKSRADGQKLLKDALSGGGGLEGYIRKPYISPNGGVGVQFVQDPEYQNDLKVKIAAKKTINQEVPTFNQTLSALDRMDEFIDKSPDYKPGVIPATLAKGDIAIKKYGNDPFVTKYQGYVDQSLSNIARKLGEKGVLTEQDIGRVINGLGRMDAPRDVRKALTAEIRTKMRDSGVGLLETAGMSKEDFAKKYPTTSNKLFGTEDVSKSKSGKTKSGIGYTIE